MFDDLDDIEDELEQRQAEAVFGEKASSNGVISSKAYFDEVARRNVLWFHPEKKAWLKLSEKGEWQGWSANGADAVTGVGDWTPWEQTLDDSDAPFYRWFTGGMTNAAFTEVDWHVLVGRGDQVAYVEEPDPTQPDDVQTEITRGALLAQSAAASRVLADECGLVQGDRVLFFLPPGVEQIKWVEACKRLGVVYCCCNPNLPPEQIADRIVIMGAKLVVTAEHPDWSFIVHRAVNNFMPVGEAIKRASDELGASKENLEIRWASRVTVSCLEPPFSDSKNFSKPEGVPMMSTKVLILDSVKVPLTSVHQKMVQASAPPVLAQTKVISDLEVPKREPQGAADVAELWKQCGAPVPVEANFPLFIIFTSGTTGKPKGVCHAHAYVAGLVETMKVSFQADPLSDDRMLTIGALGWITGQSYQISASLASGVTSILMRGNPTKPSRARFAEVIDKHKVTILKAGSAFLREVMATPEGMQQVKKTSTESLKVATFCAEPVSDAVQAFAQGAVCKNYINSYWATEHGGIVWSRKYNDPEQPLKADSHSWPMPWVDADVYAFDEASRPTVEGGLWTARAAKVGERADVVCTSPYPYMFRYVWGDVENFGKSCWTGDRSTMLSKYWRKTQLPGQSPYWVYTQGDFAVKYDDGSYTFHGRSDEVLNVNGILFGTEHIEGAILRDKQFTPNSAIGHCVVVGYPDNIAGEVPLAWITAGDPKNPPTEKDFLRLYRLVQETVGSVTVKFIGVNALPQTFSGKFLRRLLMAISRGEPLGDQSTVLNPECIPKLVQEFASWKENNGR